MRIRTGLLRIALRDGRRPRSRRLDGIPTGSSRISGRRRNRLRVTSEKILIGTDFVVLFDRPQRLGPFPESHRGRLRARLYAGRRRQIREHHPRPSECRRLCGGTRGADQTGGGVAHHVETGLGQRRPEAFLDHLSKLEEERSIEIAGINRLLLQEVADRMKMEVALRESEGRFRRLARMHRISCTDMNSSPGAIHLHQSRGEVPRRSHPGRVLRGSRPLLQTGAPRRSTPSRSGFQTECERRMLHTAAPSALRWMLEDGSIVWTEDHAVPICDETAR